jgi:hypothetical protein
MAFTGTDSMRINTGINDKIPEQINNFNYL